MDPEVGVYVRMDDHLAPRTAQVALVCDVEPSASVVDWWRAWWDEANQSADSIGIRLLPLVVFTASTLTVAEFRQFVALPLDRASPS